MTPIERADTVTAAIDTADMPKRVTPLRMTDEFATELANTRKAVWGWQVHGAGVVAVEVSIAGGVTIARVLKDATPTETVYAARLYARTLLAAADIVECLENLG